MLIDINQEKNIVSTAVAGKDGTFNEYVSDGNYNINLEGRLVFNFNLNLSSASNVVQNPAEYTKKLKDWAKNGFIDNYPEADTKSLIQILKLPVSLDVESRLLNLFGIGKIIVIL